MRLFGLLSCLVLASGGVPALTAPPGDETAPKWRLACRLAIYGKYQAAAWDHLPSIGVHHVFLSVPAPGETEQVKEKLKAHGLEPLVLRGQTDLGKPNCVDELAGQLAVCEKMGVHYMFLSPRHAGVDKETACERLRRAGDVARQHGVIIALETHPDLGTNGDVHLETMKRINHPNVRVNFDTGNITYYNRGANVVAELKKIIDYVATVELKDHGGEPRTWNFPALGQGKIDLPGVLGVLKIPQLLGANHHRGRGRGRKALERGPDQRCHRPVGGLSPKLAPFP